ncbi:hypothetical protein DSL64_07890 [Dyadobacter luteus]|jgi:hypothetical protein|uniref:Uncharacterized protein n=1 Tax=Dyadobacter luteus TaxID=2259619 RepID=A0A3D8YE78_9BACT|nr:hypothetical protein [Dyadobacter luteus]REA62834.1 hypothetical protein DSL64_07890 [Dyadobacter luteus]
MRHSNIFAYNELSKFAENLSLSINSVKSDLIAQHAYFRVIPASMFSEDLAPRWESICERVKRSGPAVDEDNHIITNEVKNTILHMSDQECYDLTDQILSLRNKVAAEF